MPIIRTQGLFWRSVSAGDSVQNHVATASSGPAALPAGRGGACGRLPVLDLLHIADDADQLVAFLVDEELALGALEALASQPPDPIVAVGAGSSLKAGGREINDVPTQVLSVIISPLDGAWLSKQL